MPSMVLPLNRIVSLPCSAWQLEGVQNLCQIYMKDNEHLRQELAQVTPSCSRFWVLITFTP